MPLESTAPAVDVPLHPGGRDVLILLDTSGSMSDQDSSGKVKIAAAKSAILQQLQEVPPTARVGLMTFPAASGSSKSGCTPAHLQLPVANSSVAEMGTILGALPAPDGGTPTSDAMLQAAQYLKNEGLTDATIVLVSDGESNCGGNPCDTAKQLRSDNIHIAVNTVGFNISDQGQKELQCVASAAGGTYVDAQDSSKLNQVLKEQFGSGLQISVSAPTGPVPMLNESFGVAVTVTEATGHSAANVQLTVRDTDPTAGTYVNRPVMSLGNFGPGTSLKTDWLIHPPTNPKLDKSTYRVSVTADGTAAMTKDFSVTYSHEQPTGADLQGSLKDFKNILVLGDSYSSGEGAGDATRPYFREGNNQDIACHRTKNQYANWLFSPEQVRILACSGAVSRNVYEQGQHNEQSQLAQLKDMLASGYRPDAIFLSITGNDIGFGDIANGCAWSAIKAVGSDAKDIATLQPLTNPLASCAASKVSGAAYTAVGVLVDKVPDSVATVLERTSQVFDNVAPTPPIIVLKYPELLAREPNEPLKCGGIQPFQLEILGNAFRDFSALQTRLNDKVSAGVAAAAAKGIHAYIAGTDTSIPPGHNLCSSDPWFVPATAYGASVGSPEMLHPNVAGHKAIAAKLNTWAGQFGTQLKPASTSLGASPTWKSATLQWWPTASEITVPLNQPGAVSVGQDIHGKTIIHVTGGAPLTGTTIYVHSSPIVLGHVQLDEDGNGSLDVDLNSTDITPGNHTLDALGTAVNGQAVVGSVPVTIPQPFPTVFWILGLIGLSMLVWAVIIFRRRQPPFLGTDPDVHSSADK
ncbi:VWA domain-containing protein [Arthrobacter bambusae]|uniref:VWA domain-containing protein n=1 Tax=Arthrobacter bambusae TaxID=1338426 RepID=UPI0027D8EA67|nr:VWA domain-containing protein [Arthrobacter bambusae]